MGLASDVVDRYFKGTATQVEGIGLEEIAGEALARHRTAWPERPSELAHRDLDPGGEWQWRREGEYHLFNPDTVFKLQHATRAKSYKIFKEYTRAVDDQSRNLATLRGLLRLRPASETGRKPVPLDEVEPVSRDREAVFDRGHVLRGYFPRGPRDTGHRHEPPGRPQQQR